MPAPGRWIRAPALSARSADGRCASGASAVARRHRRRVDRHAGRPDARVAVRALVDAAAPARPATRPRSAARRTAARPPGGSPGGSAASVTPEQVVACIGTKELVASLPRALSLRDPSRDTVLYPAVAYPTYAMGAALAGLRAVPVPVDAEWRLDLARDRPGRRRPCARALAQRPEQSHRRHRHARRAWRQRSPGPASAGSSSPATSATPSSPTTPPARPPLRSPRSLPTAGSRSPRRARGALAVEAFEHGRPAGRIRGR